MNRNTAIDPKTGKILLSLSGVGKEAFHKTLKRAFPDAEPVISASSDGKDGPKGNSVLWKGSFYDLGGYANMNRAITSRLVRNGFSVKLDILRTAPQADPTTIRWLNSLSDNRIPHEESCPLVVGFTPMPIRQNGRKVAFYTMMETQAIHQEFVNRCNRFASEVWVPCRFYVDVFRKGGVVKPIYLIPLGVDQLTYTPEAPEPQLRYEEMPSGRVVESLPAGFRFISLFGWSYRKGPDVLCRSFLAEFSRQEDAILVIYSRYMGGSGEPQKQHIRNEIAQYYTERGGDPGRIYYCGDEIPIATLPGAIAAGDCFVFCSRGEGFGLPVVEAGACGLPVISSYNTAMTQYLDDDTAFLVRPDSFAPANDKLTWITEFYRDQTFPVLGEGAVKEFSAHMRSVFSDRAAAEQKAAAFRARVLGQYTWDSCASKVIQRLRAM